jgi:hypothetical protein
VNPILRRLKAALRGPRERRERAPADLVIVSFPKSGRTWLRLLIGKALCDRYGLPEEQMLDTFALTKAAGLPPAVFSHDGASNSEARHMDRLSRDKSEYASKRVLLLARDPRDVVTSCFFQATDRRDLFRGSLAEFLRDPHYGIRKVLTWYGIWERNRGVPREFRVVRYEDLKRDPQKTLREVLEFIGVTDPDDALVTAAVEFSRFENMKKMEQERRFASSRMHPGKGSEGNKVRRGKVGGFVDYMSPEDVAWCDAAIAELGCPFVSLEA